LQRDVVTKSRGRKNLVLSAWGDESLLSEGQVNPYFVPSCYEFYSEQTQQNMVNHFWAVNLYSIWKRHADLTLQYFFIQKRLNEDVIDYELLEDLICFVDETCSEGAILVFLPVRLLGYALSWYVYLYFFSANSYIFSYNLSW